MRKDLLRRYGDKPIIAPEDMPFDCFSVFNAGATYWNGQVVLLLRVEDGTMASNFYVAKSKDGIKFEISKEPINYPISITEERIGKAGRFDMRITQMDGKIYCFHAASHKYGCCIGLCETEDFVNFKPIGHLSEPHNRNAVMFPEKINGLYARLDRPFQGDGGGDAAHTYISYSPDLEFWGRSMPLNMNDAYWAKMKNGAGAIPIKTEHGWLEIYHAVNRNCNNYIYHLGVMLLDLKDPSIVTHAPKEFILTPETYHERIGQVPNVVFTSGACEMPDGTLNVYYGASDNYTCLAQTTVKELVDYCLEHPNK